MITTILLAAALAADPQCTPQRETANRASPYDSVTVTLSGERALICYNRPSARGRTMLGSAHVPYGKLWRTGANEPTIIHLPFAAQIGTIRLQPGSYSIYSVPDLDEWEIILNRSISQWGVESAYTDEIKAQEVGRTRVKPETLKDHIETFTIRQEGAGANAHLVLEWEKTRVRVPIKAVS